MVETIQAVQGAYRHYQSSFGPTLSQETGMTLMGMAMRMLHVHIDGMNINRCFSRHT